MYDNYGKDTALNDTFTGTATNAASINLATGYQGMMKDIPTGFYVTPNRVYLTPLGVWAQQDPAGYVDGANLYQFVGGNPLRFADPFGLQETRLGPTTAPTNPTFPPAGFGEVWGPNSTAP